MATDATGTPTSLGIPKFNTAVDSPSGLGGNAQMDAIDALIAARMKGQSGTAAGQIPVWDTVDGRWEPASPEHDMAKTVSAANTDLAAPGAVPFVTWNVSTGATAGSLRSIGAGFSGQRLRIRNGSSNHMEVLNNAAAPGNILLDPDGDITSLGWAMGDTLEFVYEGSLAKWLLIGRQMSLVFARFTKAAAQSVANATATNVQWDTASVNYGGWTTQLAGGGAGSTAILVPVKGIYTIDFQFQWGANAAGYREATLDERLTRNLAYDLVNPTVNSFNAPVQKGVTSTNLPRGNEITLNVYQSSGGALDISKSSELTPRINLMRVG